MSRSLIIGLIITIAIISGLATFFYISFVKVKSRPAIDAVPNDASVVLEVRNIQKNLALFYATDMWKDLQQNEGLRKIDRNIVMIDSLVSTNSDIQSALADNKVTISFHSNGNNLRSLFIAETGSSADGDQVISWIAKVANAKSVKRTFDKETLYDIVNAQQQLLFTVAFRERLLILSEDGTLVEEAIRKLKYHFVNPSKGFEQAKALANVGSDLNVYVNYQKLPSFFAFFSKDEYKNIYDYVKQFANWSVLDIKISNDHFGISGVTFTDDSLFQFLDLFKTQTPVEHDLSAIMPLSTAYSLQIGFSSYSQFNSDLNEYLQHTGRLDEYIKYGDSIEERYHISLTEKLVPQIGNTAVLAMHESGSGDYRQQLFAMLQFKDNKAVDEIFASWVKEIEKRGEGDSTSLSYNGRTLRRLKLGNVFKLFYGHVFDQLESPFYVLHENVFILANDANVLKSILDEIDNKNTLATNESYKIHHKGSVTSSNINIFMSPGKCMALPAVYANESFISILNRFQYDFKKFEYIDIQYANSNNNTFFTNVNIKFNPSFREETKMLWMAKLDTTFTMQPAILFDTDLKQPCILVQDVSDNLYYLSNSGAILWKSKLSGKINSQVFEVDVNKNGNHSYLFSTDKQVCLINNKGVNLSGYPVRFPGTATAGINLFDFYGDSSFQYFVPLQNNKIMGYNLNGKPIAGWNPRNTDGRITNTPGGFRLGNGAYICGTSSTGRLLIYGLTPTQPKFTQNISVSSGNRAYVFSPDTGHAEIWITDSIGQAVQYKIDANLVATVINTIATEHANVSNQVVQSSGGYFILTSDSLKFSLSAADGRKIVSKNFVDTVYTQPFFTYTKEEIPMVGYTEKVSGKIYWLDTKGKLYETFPLEGNTSFSTGDLLLNNANYTVTGDSGNNIRAYRLK
jgi:hypothetical protein